MKNVIVDKNFSADFGQNYLPKVYISLIKDELNNKKYAALFTKINEKLNITKKEILDAIKIENISISRIGDKYSITFKNIRLNINTSFEQLIDYINDGDLSFRGYNVFNNATDYANEHIKTIYRYYLMKGN